MTIASGHIQNKGKVRYPDFEHGCTGLASSNLRMKPEETVIGNTYRYYFGNGYVKFSDGFAALNPQYFFYTKDHLGRSTSRKGGAFIAKRRKNVRSVVTKNHSTNEITEVQQTHYYPFGGIISDLSTGRSVQNHLYNGKELDYSNNLYWYDYGARQYDSTASRFTTPDPLAEKYYPWNYYAYCMNNPVKFIDPDGRKIVPGVSRSLATNGHGTFEAYKSHINFIAAMKIVGRTSFGKKFIGSFLEIGQSQYGVSGTGTNSGYTFLIEEVMQPTIQAQFSLMGNSEAKSWWEQDKDTGELSFILKTDVSGKSIAALVETICHEIGLHNGCIDEIVTAYQNGGIDAVNEYRQNKGDKDHSDLKNNNKNNIGVQTYNSMREELSETNEEIKKTFDNEEKKYQETY